MNAGFVANSLWNLVNNLSEGIIKLNVNKGTMITKWEAFGIAYTVCDWFLEYTNFKDD